jgi:hypothetical protein
MMGIKRIAATAGLTAMLAMGCEKGSPAENVDESTDTDQAEQEAAAALTGKQVAAENAVEENDAGQNEKNVPALLRAFGWNKEANHYQAMQQLTADVVTDNAAETGVETGSETAAENHAAILNETYMPWKNSVTPFADTYVTSVTGTAPVVVTQNGGGTTPVVSMPAATGSTNGYLTSTNWTTFNNKQNRVSGTCASGASISSIANDGSVTCADSFNFSDVSFSRRTAGWAEGNNGTAITIDESGSGFAVIQSLLFDGDLLGHPCGNVSCSYSGVYPMDVDPATVVGLFPSITMGNDHRAMTTYYDQTNTNLKVAHCDEYRCTGSITFTTIDPDPSADVGKYTSITIGSDGYGIVSYYDTTNANLKVAHCSNTECTAATLTALDTTGNVGPYTSIILGVDGLPLISYYDVTNTNLKVAHCSNVNCTSATLTTLDNNAGNVGQYSSIAVGSDGLGLVSYYDATNTNLKVAHCSNVTCTSATLTTLDNNAGNVGQYTAINVGGDGMGVMSYYDATNGDLKVAHCSNATCSVSTNVTVDSTGNVGQATAMTVGADGFPLISYYDVTNTGLKIVHCSNAFCTPYARRR